MSEEGPEALVAPSKFNIKPLLTVGDVAKLLSVSNTLVYREAAAGKLRCLKVGKGALRFRQEDVEEYLEGCEVYKVKREGPRRGTPKTKLKWL